MDKVSVKVVQKIKVQVAEIGRNFPFGNKEALCISKCLAYSYHFQLVIITLTLVKVEVQAREYLSFQIETYFVLLSLKLTLTIQILASNKYFS